MEDRWHYRDYIASRHKKYFIEWKYFNLRQNRMFMFISYGINDPENKSGYGNANIHVRVYMDGKTYGGIYFFDLKEVRFSDNNSNFKTGENSIAVNKNNYIIKGKAKDIQFQLKYIPKLKPIFDIHDSKAGSLKWEKMNWLVQMPQAKVNGWVRIEGKKIKIDCNGYHDSNWGEWILVEGMWNWLQCNGKDINIDIGEVYNKNEGEIVVEFKNQPIIFKKDQYGLKHTVYEKDSTGVKIPSTTVIEASNEKYRLELTVTKKINQCLHFKIPVFFLPDYYVDEQIAKFEGKLFMNNEVVAKINNIGFREYTTKAYPWLLKWKNMM